MTEHTYKCKIGDEVFEHTYKYKIGDEVLIVDCTRGIRKMEKLVGTTAIIAHRIAGSYVLSNCNYVWSERWLEMVRRNDFSMTDQEFDNLFNE